MCLYRSYTVIRQRNHHNLKGIGCLLTSNQMEKELAAFLSQYISLSETDMEVISSLSLFKEVKKGTILLKEGQESKQCYLVLKGCVTSYFLLNGEEKTTEFFTELQPIIPVSYIKQQPSEYYLGCVEDCILSIGSEQ